MPLGQVLTAAEIDRNPLEWNYGTRALGVRKSIPPDLAGNCSVMGAQVASCPSKWLRGPTSWLIVYEALRATYCFSRVHIFYGCSQPAGWLCHRMVAGYCF